MEACLPACHLVLTVSIDPLRSPGFHIFLFLSVRSQSYRRTTPPLSVTALIGGVFSEPLIYRWSVYSPSSALTSRFNQLSLCPACFGGLETDPDADTPVFSFWGVRILCCILKYMLFFFYSTTSRSSKDEYWKCYGRFPSFVFHLTCLDISLPEESFSPDRYPSPRSLLHIARQVRFPVSPHSEA